MIRRYLLLPAWPWHRSAPGGTHWIISAPPTSTVRLPLPRLAAPATRRADCRSAAGEAR